MDWWRHCTFFFADPEKNAGSTNGKNYLITDFLRAQLYRIDANRIISGYA